MNEAVVVGSSRRHDTVRVKWQMGVKGGKKN